MSVLLTHDRKAVHVRDLEALRSNPTFSPRVEFHGKAPFASPFYSNVHGVLHQKNGWWVGHQPEGAPR